jgi:hypothetical protein
MHDCPKDKASLVDGVLTEGCKLCLVTAQGTSLYYRKYQRDRMKENHRKDLIQRYDGDKINKEWVEAYPDKAIEGLGQETVERILRT